MYSFLLEIESNSTIPIAAIFILQYYIWSYVTPFITTISSYASSGNTPITLGGYLYSIGFDDPNDPETSVFNIDRDYKKKDFYSRILVGGRVCDHMRENGSW